MKKKLLVLGLGLSMIGAVFATSKYPEVTSNDLGALSLSVHKFDSKTSLDKHHQHLLDMANSTKNSVLVRYTYALLLGINHANDETREMAIGALEKLEADKALSSGDKAYIQDMKNLIIYEVQHGSLDAPKDLESAKSSGKPVDIDHASILEHPLVNEYGTKLEIKNIDKSTGAFKAQLVSKKGSKISINGFMHDDIITFSSKSVSQLGYIHDGKIKTWWLSSINVDRNGGDQVNMGDSTWMPQK